MAMLATSHEASIVYLDNWRLRREAQQTEAETRAQLHCKDMHSGESGNLIHTCFKICAGIPACYGCLISDH